MDRPVVVPVREVRAGRRPRGPVAPAELAHRAGRQIEHAEALILLVACDRDPRGDRDTADEDFFHGGDFCFHDGTWVMVKGGANFENDIVLGRELDGTRLHDLAAG